MIFRIVAPFQNAPLGAFRNGKDLQIHKFCIPKSIILSTETEKIVNLFQGKGMMFKNSIEKDG